MKTTTSTSKTCATDQTIITPGRPTACPRCGAAVVISSDKRTQFACFALAVRLDAPEGWLLRESCGIPARDSLPVRMDRGPRGPEVAFVDGEASAAAVGGPVAPESTQPAKGRVVVALVGGLRDWQDLRRRYPGRTPIVDVIAAESWGGEPAAAC